MGKADHRYGSSPGHASKRYADDVWLSGPRLLSLIAAGLAVMCTLLVLIADSSNEAAHLVIRWTARTSLVLLLLAYIARPATQLRPRGFKRLLAFRKWLGLGFFTSHVFHLAGIIALAAPDVGAFVRSQSPTILVAVANYLLLFAMAVTSIERVRKAMPPPAWKRLHRIGMHTSWFVFFTTYATATLDAPVFAIPTVLLVAAAAIRTAAWQRGKHRAISIG